MVESNGRERDTGTDGSGTGRKTYVITFLCAAAIAAAYAAAAGVFSMHDAGGILGYLSNAVVVPGVLLMGLSGLNFVKRQGGFDAVSYTARYMSSWLLPQFWLNSEERSGKLKSYRDYCEDKRRREKGRRNMSLCFLLVGAVFTALGVLCLVAMNMMFPGTVLWYGKQKENYILTRL